MASAYEGELWEEKKRTLCMSSFPCPLFDTAKGAVLLFAGHDNRPTLTPAASSTVSG